MKRERKKRKEEKKSAIYCLGADPLDSHHGRNKPNSILGVYFKKGSFWPDFAEG
jgi:hypothetical protein